MVLRNSRHSDFKKIEDIYLQSFPPEERRPFADLIGRTCDHSSRLRLLTIEHDESVVGLISYWQFDSFRYIEHFAIESQQRSGGIGSRALSDFISRDSRPVVIEVEPPETDEMAKRRIEFYRRAGFNELEDFEYIQPPYAPGLPSVRLMLMTTVIEQIDVKNVVKTLHKSVYDQN